jgi:predicted metallo-beta-lactamase superfamily hydrolase
MCTMVQTSNISIILDPGVSLAPYRFGLLPHPLEFQNIRRLREIIAKVATKVDVLTISHYHFDHHTPSFEDWLVNWTAQRETANQIYCDKTILMKNPKENINPSQRHRAWIFQRTGGKNAKKLAIADGRAFTFGNTKIRFSVAVPHGSQDGLLGWVIMAIVECEGERFIHASDVQGPMSNSTTELILSEKPDVVMLSGPPLYLSGFKVEKSQIEKGIQNLTNIVKNVPLTIMEHHVLRDEEWMEKTKSIRMAASISGHILSTAATFVGKENNFLEYRRKSLYLDYPPSEEFERWTKLNSDQLSHVKPPV